MVKTVEVTLDANKKPLIVTLPDSVTPSTAIFHVKRVVAAALSLDPTAFRLQPTPDAALPDHLALPVKLIAVQRPPRNTTLFATIRVTADTNVFYQVKLDPQDNVVDAKFLLSKVTGVSAENIFLYAGGAELSNSASAAPLSTAKPESVKIQFRFIDKDGVEYRRSVPQLISVQDQERATIKKMWFDASSKFGNINFLGARTGPNGNYTWQTYSQVSQRITNIIAGLVSLGAKKGDKIGIWAINRPEWLMIDLVCCIQGYISVPLYDTLGPSACEFVLNHSESRFLFVEGKKAEEAKKLQKKCKSVEKLVVFDSDSKAKDFTDLKSLEALGQEAIKKGIKTENKVTPSDILSICYTSGTTGDPKGVVLTQGSCYAACTALSLKAMNDLKDPGLILISYLPLAHIYERILELGVLVFGQSVGYFSGDVTKLVEDVAELKPHIFPGVPRVWQRVYDRITGQIADSNFIRRMIANHAFATKQAMLTVGDRSETIWDKIVFSKIKDRFGGNLRIVSTGAAPLSAKIAEFLIVGLNTNFAEGYGLTETCATSCITDRYDNQFGHVGTPTACVEIKLVDIPEMDYLTSDKPSPRGEIWFRGPAVFSGYYKNPEITAESITSDGWFKTGDVGLWRPDGNLQIIDRKKNIFKLSQGEYIRPEYIENVYKQSKFVGNIFVYGDSLQQYLVAIVVPNFENVLPWAKTKGIGDKPAELIKKPELLKLILEDMKVIAAREKLRGFEEVSKITLHGEDFTVENDLLTPSMKLKRHQAKLRFKKEIDAMYSEQLKAKL